MSVSKKDFVAIAKIIKSEVTSADDLATKVALTRVASELGLYFRSANSAFDAQRFLDACGIV